VCFIRKTSHLKSYKSLDSILRRHLDQQPLSPAATAPSFPAHTNIRGRGLLRVRRRVMLHQPTIEKLLAMRMESMVESWRSFEQDENAQQLSFEAELSLMVDRLWTWRQNLALERK
jgi:hypothetical protein